MVKIRLKRLGRRNRPFYRLVAIDSRTRRDGREIERLGWYNPISKDEQISFNEERIVHWLNNGAQVSDTVNSLMKKIGLLYKIHLGKNGKSDSEIEKLMTEWRESQVNKIKRKQDKKIKKKEEQAKQAAEAASEEAPAEEAPAEAASEEAPAEEAPAEAASEEAPAEEASKED